MSTLPTREQVANAVQGILSDLSWQLESEGLPGVDTADAPEGDEVYFSGQLPRIEETWTDEDGVTGTESVYDGGWGFVLKVTVVQRD